LDSFYVAVNLSARQLQDENLEEKVTASLEGAGLGSERLVLEITESAIMQDVDAALGRVSSLKKLGVGLAIDDFGTGYSSLSQLQKFPFDALKIDKSFVDAINRSVVEMTPAAAKDVALVRMIVALGRALGLRVVAEGIEEGLQGSLLLEYGCEVGQGFHYARPLTAGDFADEFLLKSAEGASAAA
jgi:EAL domain-containing protein (putative c-di-GMP-specific phosphodiesterase class I)